MLKKVKTITKLLYEIRPSHVFPGQVATFAVRNIKKGDVLDSIDTPEESVILKLRDFKKLDPITRRKIKEFCPMDEDDEYIVPFDLNNMGTSWYFNHSCSSPVGFDKKGNFVALRNIKKDEELSLDYGRSFSDPKFKLKCACGASNCRGTVTGNDWLNPEFRKDNLDKMWPDLRRAAAKKGKRQ